MRAHLSTAAVLIATAAIAYSGMAQASETGVTGTGCHMVNGSWVQQANTQYYGSTMQNLSSTQLYAICPVQLDTAVTYTKAVAYGGNTAMNTGPCSLFYSDLDTDSYRYKIGTRYTYEGGYRTEWTGSLLPAGMEAASIDCSMGQSSTLYLVKFTY